MMTTTNDFLPPLLFTSCRRTITERVISQPGGEVLDHLQELYAITNALMLHASKAPPELKAWAEPELRAVCEILERLRPANNVGVGADWWCRGLK